MLANPFTSTVGEAGSFSCLGEVTGDSVRDSSVVTPSNRDSLTGEISSLAEKDGEEVEGEEVEREEDTVEDELDTVGEDVETRAGEEEE